MADPHQKSPKNVPGKFYVDCNCLDHDLCGELAPCNFARDAEHGMWYVCKQPDSAEELAACRLAAECCPMAAIGEEAAPST